MAYKNNLVLAYPIESVSRKFALRRETAGEKSVTDAGSGTKTVKIPATKFMGGMVRHRRVMTGTGKIEQFTQQSLFVKKYGRSTPIGANEIKARSNFAKVSTAVAGLRVNLTQMSYIQQQWERALTDPNIQPNGVSRIGYENLWDWVFAVQYAGLKADQSYDVNHFPGAPQG